MSAHPYVNAVLSDDPVAALAPLIATDVVYRTPLLTQDLQGRDEVLSFIGTISMVLDHVRYREQIVDGDRTLLFWEAAVNDGDLDAVTELESGPGGVIIAIETHMRTWPAVSDLRDRMLVLLADRIPLAYWQLGSGNSAPADLGLPTPVRHKSTPGVVYHSPMLTKPVTGDAELDAIHQLVGGIQGHLEEIHAYNSVGRVINTWRCVMDGHEIYGVSVNKIDETGRLAEQTVYLRPWPPVRILRDAAMAGQLPFLTGDFWTLPARA